MITINLAPPDRQPRAAGAGLRIPVPRLPEFNLGLAFVVAYLLTALALGAFWWHLMQREEHLTADIQRETANLAALKARVGQAAKIKETLAELQKRLDAIQALIKDQTRAVVLLDTLADVVPRELWLTGLEERGPTLRITGTSFSTTAVSDFMSNLRSSGRFKEVDIVVSKQDHSKTPAPVTFEVTCRFES